MQYKFEVTVTREICLDIPDHMLTERAVNDFKELIDRFADDAFGLAVHTAEIVAVYPDSNFVAGIGEIGEDGIQILYNEITEVDVSSM